MNKKSFICSLVLSVLLTLSLGIYTLVSLFYVPSPKTPDKPYEPTNTTVQVAFRSGDIVDILKKSDEADGTLTFIVEEGKENPVSYNETTGKYVAGNEKGSVKAVVKINDKGDTNTYEISVYPHSDAGLTEDAPFIIANKANLLEFAGILNDGSAARRTVANGDAIKYAELVADIDLAGDNWKPMGSYTYLVEGLTFKGNGHTIKNMTINVDTENFEEFIIADNADSVATMHLGFFGAVSNSHILDLNFTGAVINVASGVYDIVSASDYTYENFPFAYLNIGVVSGYASNNTVIASSGDKNTSVSARMNAFSFERLADGNYAGKKTSNLRYSGLGGVVGYVSNAQVSKYDVDINVINNVATVYDSNIGGVVGFMNADLSDATLVKNAIENCNAKLNVTAIYLNKARIGGLVSCALNTDIKDCVVELTVKDNTYFTEIEALDDNVITTASGVAQQVYSNDVASDDEAVKASFYSSVKNVAVKNLDINMRGGIANGVAHLAGRTKGFVTFTDVSVQGSVVAREAFGFAEVIQKTTTISYTEEFEGEAIDVTLTGSFAAGFGGFVYGTVYGFKDENGNKTKINADIVGFGAKLTEDQFNDYAERKIAYDNYYISGFATYLYTNDDTAANVSNFELNVSLKDSLNMAGVVYNNVSGAVSDLDVNADIISYNYKDTEYNYSTTYMIGGVACLSGNGSSIENVNVNLNVNKDVNKDLKYGTTFFGGLVARIQNNGVTLSNNSVSGDVYFNYTYYKASFMNADESYTFYDVFLAGGLVGSFTAYGNTDGQPQDEFEVVELSNTEISNNNVKDLSIVADFNFDVMDNMNCVRIRALGVLIGNIYSNDDIDLSSNTFDNVELTADLNAFTARYSESGSSGATTVNTLGYNKTENKFVHSYGAAAQLDEGFDRIVVLSGETTQITDVNAEMLSKASLNELNTETAQ
ncbi:MAG: hypothetical protein IJS74_03550 [Clostridia bacterium]|nr:hypothetical protein [Clostridia bacterium]